MKNLDINPTKSIQDLQKNSSIQIKKIGGGDVRKAYCITDNNNKFIIKEWKQQHTKERRTKIIERLQEDEILCIKFFQNSAVVEKEKPLDESYWRTFQFNDKGFIRTKQNYILQATKESSSITKDLLRIIKKNLLELTDGKNVVFPDLNINNFVISNKTIHYIDSSTYEISLNNKNTRSLEDLLHKYFILITKWVDSKDKDQKYRKDLQDFKNVLSWNTDIEEIFLEISKRNLLYWEK